MAQTVSRLMGEYLASVPSKSRAFYRRVLDAWLGFCGDNGIDVMHARRFHIDSYRIWRERMGASRNTIATELSPICCFYEYLWQERYIERNPAEHVKRPAVRRWSDGSWLSVEQAALFLELAEGDRRPFVAAACCLLLLNGLRASEVLGLDAADYHRVGGMPVVHVNRKFDWMQEVGLSERVARSVERAKGERRKGSLLVCRGRRVTYPKLVAEVAGLGERCGVERRITPHSLRRTFATTARRQRVPDREIMASGGWSTREMLDRYDMNRLAVENTASIAVTESLQRCGKGGNPYDDGR
ncbi:tyrosine-type recombinase/integrase [Bifidobacterium olomucense]|uniref:Phage integrase family n=1 Tax=Bifidobacterium olomucense TaxID=2675324 RepID=A0A7Y0EXD2_9BIFI|nr:tyrosine-type recombinase/integrase [Bifidobacterium sp. DSM 109959]NMM98170.1 Phage integrase family [Bifidobacterium sp. DSM 109959]